MLGPIVVLFSPSSVHWLCMYFPNWRGHFLIQICQKILIWKSIHPIGNAKKNNEPWKEKGCHGLQTFEECENFHKQSILHKIEIYFKFWIQNYKYNIQIKSCILQTYLAVCNVERRYVAKKLVISKKALMYLH